MMTIRSFNKNPFFVFIFILSIPFTCFSQEEKSTTDQFINQDTSLITTIALSPENIRQDVFEAAANPEAVTHIATIQKKTREQFANLLYDYAKDEQQKIWNLTRYPGLVEQLVSGGRKSKRKIKKILKNYPSEIHETALTYGRRYYKVLSMINDLNNDAHLSFESFIKDYPAPVQASFRELIQHPEIIDLLNENTRTMITLGDAYKQNPQQLKHEFDSLNADLVVKQANDLQEWKKGLEENPEAKKEFEESARQYEKDLGYSDNDLEVNDPDVIRNYVVYPYPYWFGTPWWWDYPVWYPYPYWYNWGFYFSPFGVVYTGFPSFYFLNWYFSYGPNHYYYPHFSDYCIGYYYGHHGSSAYSVNRNVSQWISANQSRLSENFLKDPAKRPERLREFGKFEMDYQQQLRKNPTGSISRNDYMMKSPGTYPNLRTVPHESRPRENFPQQKPRNEFPIQQQQRSRSFPRMTPRQQAPVMHSPPVQRAPSIPRAPSPGRRR